jgi:hypothetical protein
MLGDLFTGWYVGAVAMHCKMLVAHLDGNYGLRLIDG